MSKTRKKSGKKDRIEDLDAKQNPKGGSLNFADGSVRMGDGSVRVGDVNSLPAVQDAAKLNFSK